MRHTTQRVLGLNPPSRSHGWKTRRPPAVVKWDGASRSSDVWDNLRRDPDLWFRDGDCYVHLHGRGQSRRGPAFKVPYSALLEAKFQPLIDKFMPRARFKSNRMNAYDYSETGNHPEGPAGTRIELFIPAPVEPDKGHSYNYHLATRNLFAFIFRRSMVGECLGSALITLLHSLQQFRTPDANNIQDLMSYMDEEGYLDLNGQPTYASAMLLLGEAFQLRDLYIDAFAHCCGMSDQLYLTFEYQFIPLATRELIHRTRSEMNSRLRKASAMLKTFLDDEMRRMNVASYPGAQKHLELFQTFLQGVYIVRFGYYPPQTAIFDAGMFCAMRHDFESLYEFLRDENLDISETTQFTTESGTSPLLSLKSFDLRYNHKTLAHPLPLLPDTSREESSSWWNRPTKTSKSRRADDLAALSRATNSQNLDVIENHLVSAYRRFEEDQVSSPIKADKAGNLGPVDGRKIRWILIYAIYQTLRRVTEVAEEIRDVKGVPYHLCISTAGLPPWEIRRSVNSFAQHQLDRGSLPLSPLSLSSLETKLDDDGNSVPANQARWNTKKRHGNPVFKGNLADSISRKSSALWHSLNLLTKHESQRPRSRLQRASWHGVVVRGRGNEVNTEGEDEKLATEMSSANLAHPLRENPTNRVPDSPDRYSHSEARTSATSETYVTRSPPKSPIEKWESERASLCTRCGLHDVNCGMSSSRWFKSSRVDDCEYQPTRRTIRLHSESPPVPPRRRPTSVSEDPRKRVQLAPLNVYKAKEKSAVDLNIQMPSPQAPTAWDYIQGVMEIQARNYESHVEAEWNRLTHLGRLNRADTPAPATTSTSTSRRASAMF
ncbi:hypothetical protein CHU98_g10263 [Xylaria longipes]|nr:hypothetical protein CHU98_g10263 [Xylaria longipes]